MIRLLKLCNLMYVYVRMGRLVSKPFFINIFLMGGYYLIGRPPFKVFQFFGLPCRDRLGCPW